MFVYDEEWTGQPQVISRLSAVGEAANPAFVWSAVDGRDIVTGARPSYGAGVTKGPVGDAIALTFSGTQSSSDTWFGPRNEWNGAASFWVLAVCSVTNGVGDVSYPLCQWSSSDADTTHLVAIDQTGVITLALRLNGTGTYAVYSTSAGVAPTGKQITVGVKWESGSTAIVYLNGVAYTTTRTGTAASDTFVINSAMTTGKMQIGCSSGGVGKGFAALVVAGVKPPPNLQELTRAPWQLFEPESFAIPVGAAGGPFSYTVDLVELIAFVDAGVGASVLASAQTEATTLTDASTAGAGASKAQAESVTLADAGAAGVTSPVAGAESFTLADSSSASETFAISEADSFTPADVSTGLATANAAGAEALTLTDTSVGSLGNVQAQLEAFTLTDAGSTTAQFVSAQAESLTPADSLIALLATAAANADSFTPADSSSALREASATQAELLSLVAASVATTVTTAAEDEAVTLTDAWSVFATQVAANADDFTLADTSTAGSALTGGQADALNLAETCFAVVTKFAAQVESFSLTDTSNATLVTLGTLVPGVRFIKRGGYDRTINREATGRRIVRTGC